MADSKSQSPKVLQKGAFGQVQEITLDTNRPSLQLESLWRAQNLVAFSTRDIYADALTWILTPAFTLSTILLCAVYFLPAIAAIALIVFLLVPPLLLICQAAMQSAKTHYSAAMYRLLLIFVGFCLAVVPMVF